MHSIRYHPASVSTQIRQFGRGAPGHDSDQDAAHSGGSRAMGATSSCHVTRLVFQSMSVLVADYAFVCELRLWSQPVRRSWLRPAATSGRPAGFPGQVCPVRKRDDLVTRSGISAR